MAMKKGDLLTMQMYSNLQVPLKEVVKGFLREARMGEVKLDGLFVNGKFIRKSRNRNLGGVGGSASCGISE